MDDNIPLISGDDNNVILEDKSLQEYADEISQDSAELIEESKDVLESTMEIIASTEEIESASEAGLLSGLALKAYSNRVNSYLDKLHSKHIIPLEDKSVAGLQFDNPHAGLLSMKETLKSAIRKVIEWFSNAINYLFNWGDMLSNKIAQFIASRAGISKSLRKKIEDAKDADYFFVDTKVYENIVKKRALEFDFAIKGKLKDMNFSNKDKILIESAILTEKLDVIKILSSFEGILEDKTKSRIPTLTEDGKDIVIRDLNNPNKIEQLFINDNFEDLMVGTSLEKFVKPEDENSDNRFVQNSRDYTYNVANPTIDHGLKENRLLPRNTRAIIDHDKVLVLIYSEKGLSLRAYANFVYTLDKNITDNIKININEKDKPSIMIDELNHLVKIIDGASNTLKSMAKDSKDRAKSIKTWGDKNVQELKKMVTSELEAKRDEKVPDFVNGEFIEKDKTEKEKAEYNEKLKNLNDDSKIFNSEFRNRLNMNIHMLNKFPSIVTAMMRSLASTVDDGARLIEASLVKSPAKAERSKTTSNEDGRYLLLAAPEKREEIIDVEVL